MLLGFHDDVVRPRCKTAFNDGFYQRSIINDVIETSGKPASHESGNAQSRGNNPAFARAAFIFQFSE
ncbi:MAG: hypothetical protein UY05_C0047G0003 [Candidatus Peregrinibacteria bacterium GW2011_GWA2_47_7]|nr:MAG: hypothetical protein UY05_C0047G0003 [Candidatus Peregrinibacteria bacterium GW2011_GWA2_47_7]